MCARGGVYGDPCTVGCVEEEGERCRFTTPQSTKYGARHRLGDAPYALEREPKEINKLSIKIEKDACSERGRVKTVSQSVIHSPFRSSNQSTADPGCLVMPALPVAWCLKLSSRGPDTAVPWFLTRPGGVRRDKGMTRPGFGVRHHIFGDTHVHVQVPGPGCRGNGRVPANDTRTARGGVEFFELLS